jgi:hypothetical protein
MKSTNKEFTLVLLVFLFAGCSKKPALNKPTLGDWSSTSTIIISPRVPIEPLHSGMTIQEVIAEVGQPTRTNATGLEFSNLGFFICPNTEEFTLFPPFGGHTKEGIGMGSTRADVIKAYGEPTTAKTTGAGFELLRYAPLDMKFQIHDGKVDWIDVFSQPAKMN